MDPLLRKHLAFFGELFEERSGRPIAAVLFVELADALVHFVQAGYVGIEHRAAAVHREAVPVDVNDIAMRCLLR